MDEIRLLSRQQTRGGFLVGDPRGNPALPVWRDHVGPAGTIWEQYKLVTLQLTNEVPADAWTTIRRG